MSLSPYTEPDTIPNTDCSQYALLEQILLARTIYDHGPTAMLDQALQAGGPITRIIDNDADPEWTKFPEAKPVYVCWRQGGEVWVQVKGTYSSIQWAANVFGVIFVTSLGTHTTQSFQGAWARMAEAVWAEIKATSVGADAVPINFAGHSLGGAVAWNLGALAKQSFPTRTIRVLTMGTPRPMRGEYTGVKPSPAYDYMIAKDPVTYTPPNIPPVIGAPWQTQGERVILSPQGESLKSNVNDGELLPSINPNNWFYGNHSLTTYEYAARVRYDSAVAPRETTNALIQWQFVPPAPRPTPAPPAPIPPPPNAAPVNTTPTGFLGGSMPFLLTMTFAFKKWGWAEEHYWVGRDLATFTRDAQGLADRRRKCLSPLVTLEQLRFAPCDDTGRTSSIGAGEITYGPFGTGLGQAPGDGNTPTCAPPWRVLYVRAYTANRQYARNFFIGGIRNNIGCQDLDEWATAVSNMQSANKSAMDNYLCFLCNGICPDTQFVPEDFRPGVTVLLPSRQAAAPAVPGASPALAIGNTPQGLFSFKVRDKGVGRGKPFTIPEIRIDDGRSLWIKPGKEALTKVNPVQGTLTLNQRIHIHGLTNAGLVGMNGDTRIVQVGSVAPFLGFYRTTIKQPCPCTWEPYLGEGTYWTLETVLQPYAFARYGRIVTKKRGPVKFGTRGRRRKKCKKC